MAMDKRVVGTLLIIVFAILVSSILSDNYDTAVENIYSFEPHSVNVTIGDTTELVDTPDPVLSSELQTKMYGLAPIGVWVGAGLSIFLMWFSFGRKR